MEEWISVGLKVFLLVVTFAGCTSVRSVAPPTNAPAAGPAFPTGSLANGDWAWQFHPDGTYVVSGPPGSETGTFIVQEDQVTLTCQCCGEVEGTYTWSFAGGELKLTALDDPCENRKDVLDGSTWSQTAE